MADSISAMAAQMVSGGAAAGAAAVFTNPLEVVKTRLQVQGELVRCAKQLKYRGVLHSLHTIAKEEGIAALQKGVSGGVSYQFLMNTIRIGCYPSVKKMLGDDGSASARNFSLQVAAASITGLGGAIVGSPIFLIKCRLQVASNVSHHSSVGHQHRYKGLADGLSQVYRSEGVRGLFRGVMAAIPRLVVGSAGQLATYDSAKVFIMKRYDLRDGVFAHFCAGMVAGLVVTTAMNPFDVVTTRLYNQPKGEQQLYSGVWDCWKKIWKAEGMRGFSKGWFAHYARLGPHSVLSLMFLEQIRKTTAYLEEKRAERSSRRANSGSYTHHLRRVDSTQLA